MLRREVIKMGGGLFGLGAGTPSRFPYPGRPQPSPGVSPAPATTLRARTVIVFGPTGSPVGVFVYQPGTTPALGNPPIASMTASTVDPFGNAVKPDISVYGTGGSPSFISLLPGNPAVVNVGTGDAVEGAPGKLTTSVSGSGGTKILTSFLKAPAVAGQPGTTSASLQLTSPSADLTTVPVSLDLQVGTATSSNALQMNPGYGAFVTPQLRIISNGPGGTGAMVIIPPSGDTTGATDVAAINFALANTFNVQLTTGTYYVNAAIRVPAHGMLRGAGRDALTSPFVTTIQAVGALNAVIASGSWLDNLTTGLNGGQVRDLTVNGNNTGVNGIVLQTFDGWVDNVQALNFTGTGIAWSALGANGTTVLTQSLTNNKVSNCAVSNCSVAGIAAFEAGSPPTHSSKVFTDGYCLFNVVTGCTIGIQVDQSSDWDVIGNHVYTIQKHGMILGDMWNTKVIGNEIDQWGRSATAGFWYALNAFDSPSFAGMNVIANNVIDMQLAPGNAGSTMDGIVIAINSAATDSVQWMVVGNGLWCEPAAATFVAANPLIATNNAAANVQNIASTGNLLHGNWSSAAWIRNLAGGTINLTTGI